MAQVKTIQTEQSLTDEQTGAFRRQLEQMEQLSLRQQEQIRSCREFLAERDLLAEYESRYGSLTAVDLGTVSYTHLHMVLSRKFWCYGRRQMGRGLLLDW